MHGIFNRSACESVWGTLPNLEGIRKLQQFINSSERNRTAFCEEALKETDSLLQGITRLLCGHFLEAVKNSIKAKTACKNTFCWDVPTGHCYEKAIEQFERAQQSDDITVALEKVETWRLAGDYDKGPKRVEGLR